MQKMMSLILAAVTALACFAPACAEDASPVAETSDFGITVTLGGTSLTFPDGIWNLDASGTASDPNVPEASDVLQKTIHWQSEDMYFTVKCENISGSKYREELNNSGSSHNEIAQFIANINFGGFVDLNFLNAEDNPFTGPEKNSFRLGLVLDNGCAGARIIADDEHILAVNIMMTTISGLAPTERMKSVFFSVLDSVRFD